jgi:hypothetical protein
LKSVDAKHGFEIRQKPAVFMEIKETGSEGLKN